MEAGADGLVLMLQGAGGLGARAVEGYFAEVAGSVGCPVVLYSNPAALGSGLGLESIAMEVISASAHVPLLVFMLGGVG